MYVVYILKSIRDNTYYVGYTQNLNERIKLHNNGRCRYTKGHIPYKVVYLEKYETIIEAKEREKYIKGLKNTDSFLRRVQKDVRAL